MSLLTTSGTPAAHSPRRKVPSFFSIVSPQVRRARLRFHVVPTSAARIAIPRILSDAVVNWTDEGEEITPSDPNADSRRHPAQAGLPRLRL